MREEPENHISRFGERYFLPFQIESLKLNNIGPFEKFEASFSPDTLNIIYGLNGSRKSIILRSILFAFGRRHRFFNKSVSSGGTIKLKLFQNQNLIKISDFENLDNLTKGYGCWVADALLSMIPRKKIKVKPLIWICWYCGGVNVSCEDNDLLERLLECEAELAGYKNEVATWTDSLEELSELEDALTTKGKKLHGKTILDVGTDCVKPLYIALKYEPTKIVGINEEFPMSFVSDIERNSKLFTRTKIRFYSCSLFDQGTIDRILEKEGIKRFDFVLVSKTLHHLRVGDCIAKKRDPEHKHREDEKGCIYKFEVKEIFDRLLQLGKRVIIYESFYPQEKDEDKVRGRGGYVTTEEWRTIFTHLLKNYSVELVKPLKCQLDEKELENVIAKLRQVDYVCFYVVV